MKQKKKALFIGVCSILLILLSCSIIEPEINNTHVEATKIEEVRLSPKIELTNLINKTHQFKNVILVFKETEILNETTTQEKTTNISYNENSIKIINELTIKQKKGELTITPLKEKGFELLKNNIYTQCIQDFDLWICEETPITNKQFQEVSDEIKDKNFLEEVQTVEKTENNCFLINELFSNCYDDNGFLIAALTENKKIERKKIEFKEDSFELPENAEFI